MSENNTHDELEMADDIVRGVGPIAAYIGEPERRTYHLLVNKRLPGFMLGGRWYLRKSRYKAYIERLENEAAAAA